MVIMHLGDKSAQIGINKCYNTTYLNKPYYHSYNNMASPTNQMYELGMKYGTDKVTHHEYHLDYDHFLKPFYNSTGSILEIGIYQGSSLLMWKDLFPNAFIYGMDIGLEYSGDRHFVMKGDQSKESDLIQLRSKLLENPPFFINDDGSHVPGHQLLTFNTLFPALKEGGIYIIEDIETSYWRNGSLYGYNVQCGYKHPKSIIELFKDCADVVNSEFAGPISSQVAHLNQIGSITFARNCIIITKRTIPFRKYRFAGNL